MPYGEVGGGLVRRYWCNNPRCREPWHYSSWCPTLPSSVPPYRPLSPERALELAQRQEEQRRRAAQEATQDPPAPEPPRYWWLWEAIPVLILFGVGMLVLMLYA